MPTDGTATYPLTRRISARRDPLMWVLLLAGAFFWWAGSVVDPATNCDTDGDCAPWLVPVAKYMGVLFALSAAARMIVNPERGVTIEADSGDLIWWQDRTTRSPGDQGRIAPEQIGKIRIVRQSDNSDEVHLYDRAGERQPYFDNQILVWRQERWAKALIDRYPHIVLEIVD